jgi:primosomal protein N' (replication factor Y)
LAGRAGRADSPGKVIIQTYSPDHYALKCALRQDYRAFYNAEISYRKRSLYPPYATIARLLMVSQDAEAAFAAAKDASEQLREALTQNGLMQHVLSVHEGPAPIKRIKGEERYEVLVKMYTAGDTKGVIAEMEKIENKDRGTVKAELEVNPANMF